MMPKLSERARRLIDALNLFWARRSYPSGLEALFTYDDDAAYAADTRDLAAFDARQRLTVPADCPLPDCLTCDPLEPTEAIEPSGSALLGRGFAIVDGKVSPSGEAIREVWAWLRYEHADAWRDVDEGKLQRIALALIELRDAVERRERVPG